MTSVSSCVKSKEIGDKMDAECMDGKLENRSVQNNSFSKFLTNSMNWKFSLNISVEWAEARSWWKLMLFHCFQIQNVFAVCNPKKHSIKCSLIRSKGMCARPLCIQNTEWCVNPDMWSPSKCFQLLPPLLYRCLESYRTTSLLLKGPLSLKWWPETPPNNTLQDTV